MNDRSRVAACDGVVRSGARSLHAEAVESLRSGAMPSATAVPQAEAAAGSSQAPASPSTSAELEAGEVAATFFDANQLSGPCGGSALRRVLHRRPAHFGSL